MINIEEIIKKQTKLEKKQQDYLNKINDIKKQIKELELKKMESYNVSKYLNQYIKIYCQNDKILYMYVKKITDALDGLQFDGPSISVRKTLNDPELNYDDYITIDIWSIGGCGWLTWNIMEDCIEIISEDEFKKVLSTSIIPMINEVMLLENNK